MWSDVHNATFAYNCKKKRRNWQYDNQMRQINKKIVKTGVTFHNLFIILKQNVILNDFQHQQCSRESPFLSYCVHRQTHRQKDRRTDRDNMLC